MPSHDNWNRALHAYFLRGVPAGSTVYLEVSEESLERIGRRFLGEEPSKGWVEDFLDSVKQRVVRGDGVELDSFKKFDGTQLESLPFLATLVLVASRMGRSGELHESNYFARLNRALGTSRTSQQNPRPKGMDSGYSAEEPLWLEWGRMLRLRGLLPTARPGEGARRYINYALSQTLFREADKQKLRELFSQNGWPRDLDGEALATLLRSSSGLTTQISQLLSRVGSDAEAVEGALQEIYSDWLDTTSGITGRGSRRTASSTIHCGLYRTLHFRTREPQYRLLPARPWRSNGPITVVLDDGPVQLMDKGRYFEPVAVEITSQTLAEGLSLPVSDNPDFESLLLPSRKVWALTSDEFDGAAFGSFGKPEVGEHFALLAHESLSADIERASEQGLIKFRSKAKSDTLGDQWIEYEEMLVLAHQLSEATDISSALRDAICPVSTFSLRTSGGLVVPGRKSWLQSSPPAIGINSYFSAVSFSVSRDSETIQEGTVTCDPSSKVAVDIEWQGVGGYEIAAQARGLTQRVLVNLVDWQSLPAPSQADIGIHEYRVTEGLSLVGPQLVAGEA